MDRPASETATTATFVVRFWHEWTNVHWQGRIEHVESGQQRDFLDLDKMLRFLQQMGITVAQPADHDEHRMPIPPSGSR